MAPAVSRSWLNGLGARLAPQQDEADFIECDTSIPPRPRVSWGMRAFPYIPCPARLRGGTLRGEEVHHRKLQTQSETFAKRGKVRRRSSMAYSVWVPLNQPLS